MCYQDKTQPSYFILNKQIKKGVSTMEKDPTREELKNIVVTLTKARLEEAVKELELADRPGDKHTFKFIKILSFIIEGNISSFAVAINDDAIIHDFYAAVKDDCLESFARMKGGR